MDHGGTVVDTAACKIHMLWNWETIDACFLSSTWHIRSGGAMAASCIGVMLLTVSLELLRRLGKEYDAFLARGFNAEAARMTKAASALGESDAASRIAHTFTFRASPVQQLARAVLHGVTFGVAYIIMLLAMYFNGYIIISIFLGATVGKFLCDWMVVKVVSTPAACREPASYSTNEHGVDEPTVCCG